MSRVSSRTPVPQTREFRPGQFGGSADEPGERIVKADYVWLSPEDGSERRIPWTPALAAWFNANFAKLRMSSPGIGQLYIRVRK